MKTLYRLCAAAVVAAAVTACGEMPTAPQAEVAPARHNGGGFFGGGSRSTDGDTTTVMSVSSDGSTTEVCAEGRGGGFFGGGSYMEPLPCE